MKNTTCHFSGLKKVFFVKYQYQIIMSPVDGQATFRHFLLLNLKIILFSFNKRLTEYAGESIGQLMVCIVLFYISQWIKLLMSKMTMPYLQKNKRDSQHQIRMSQFKQTISKCVWLSLYFSSENFTYKIAIDKNQTKDGFYHLKTVTHQFEVNDFN